MLMDLAAALEAEGMTEGVCRAVLTQVAPERLARGVQAAINESARAMTDVRVPFGVQVNVFLRAFGVGIGGGGGAGWGSPRCDPCPWCGGTGNHGALCPGPALGYGPRPDRPDVTAGGPGGAGGWPS
jgi:hypothetical protein